MDDRTSTLGIASRDGPLAALANDLPRLFRQLAEAQWQVARNVVLGGQSPGSPRDLERSGRVRRMSGDLIWLVRHGQSTANAGEPARDYPSIPLSELGELQARAFVARVPQAPDRIVYSSFVRSRQTAQPLLEAHPRVEALERPVHEFSYLWFPGDRLMTWRERVPLVDAYWARLDPHHREAGRGENYAELVERVRTFLDEAAGWRGFSVVFSHEQFMRAVALSVLTGGLAPSADSMRRFVVWRHGWPVPNVACLALRRLHGRWWVAGGETG